MQTQTVQHRFHLCHQYQAHHHFQQDQDPLLCGHPSWWFLLSDFRHIDHIHLARRCPQRALERLAHVPPLDLHPAANVEPPVRDRVFLPAGQLCQVSNPPGPVDDPSGVNAAEAAAGVGLVDGGFHRLDAICKDGSRFSTFNLAGRDWSLEQSRWAHPAAWPHFGCNTLPWWSEACTGIPPGRLASRWPESEQGSSGGAPLHSHTRACGAGLGIGRIYLDAPRKTVWFPLGGVRWPHTSASHCRRTARSDPGASSSVSQRPPLRHRGRTRFKSQTGGSRLSGSQWNCTCSRLEKFYFIFFLFIC